MLRNGSRNLTDENIERIRRFRREMGASEKVMWAQLRGERLGVRFRRQHPVGPYALDFYCAEAMLCVEVDGEIHALQLEKDARRDAALSREGILTYRVPSLCLFDEDPRPMGAHLQEIAWLCAERSARKPK